MIIYKQIKNNEYISYISKNLTIEITIKTYINLKIIINKNIKEYDCSLKSPLDFSYFFDTVIFPLCKGNTSFYQELYDIFFELFSKSKHYIGYYQIKSIFSSKFFKPIKTYNNNYINLITKKSLKKVIMKNIPFYSNQCFVILYKINNYTIFCNYSPVFKCFNLIQRNKYLTNFLEDNQFFIYLEKFFNSKQIANYKDYINGIYLLNQFAN